ADARPVVEIEEHRWTLRGADEQITKFPQRVWTDHVALVAGRVVLVSVFVEEDVEVIEQEIGHHLLQLALTVNRAKELGLLQFADRDAGRISERLERLALFRSEVSIQPATQIARCSCAERKELISG